MNLDTKARDKSSAEQFFESLKCWVITIIGFELFSMLHFSSFV
jgi:hypothetical protein